MLAWKCLNTITEPINTNPITKLKPDDTCAWVKCVIIATKNDLSPAWYHYRKCIENVICWIVAMLYLQCVKLPFFWKQETPLIPTMCVCDATHAGWVILTCLVLLCRVWSWHSHKHSPLTTADHWGVVWIHNPAECVSSIWKKNSLNCVIEFSHLQIWFWWHVGIFPL